MKHRLASILAAAGLVAGLVFVAPAATVLAAATDPGCAALGGNDAGLGTECIISTFVARTGTYNLGEGLRITGAGRIDASGGGITINLCVPPASPSATCDLILETPTVATGGQIEARDTGAAGNSGSPIVLNLSRNVLMQAGSAILSDNTNDGGGAGNITITAGGNMTMCGKTGAQPGCGPAGTHPGALISAQKLSGGTAKGGDVTIKVGSQANATGAFYMEGGATTYGAETGARIDTTSRTDHAGTIAITAGRTYFTEPGSVVQSGDTNPATATRSGGKIYIVANCGLTTEGRITSKGPDFGADLVHLESCDVIVRGLVESTGKGHVANAPNNCDLIPDGLVGEVLRDHPANSTGCIEVWAHEVTIDSSSLNPATGRPWAGELNADIGDGGPAGTSWIDIFAFSKLTVTDGTGNDVIRDNFGGTTYFSTYAVHANAMADTSDTTPAVVTALVKSGPLTASGKAFEASSTLTAATGHAPGPFFTGNGSTGGTVDLEASGNVTLDTAFVNASGDFLGGPPCPSGTGACGLGGHIIVDAWGVGSNISWTSGSGDVRPDASGDITLTACGTITLGADFHGETPTQTNGCDPALPAIPVITPANGGPVFKPELWAACATSSISGVKFNDTNANGVKDASEPGLAGWTIHIFSGTFHQTTVTGVGGAYSFTGLAAGTYTVCEQLIVPAVPPWQQTFPVGPGAGLVDCTLAADPAGDNPNPGKWGYTVTVTLGDGCNGQDITGKNFGNVQLAATKSGYKFNDLNGNHVADNLNGIGGEPGLNGWTITIWNSTQTAVVQTTVTANDTSGKPGFYQFLNLAPGNYVVCETPQATWTQTFPQAGAGFVTCTNGTIGWSITLAAGQNDTDNNFGNFKTTVCEKLPVQNVLNPSTGYWPGNLGPDYVVRVNHGDKVQDAVNNAALHRTATTGDINGDGVIIILVLAHDDGTLGGSSAQKVVIDASYGSANTGLRFGLIGCSVTLTGGGTGPAISIASTANARTTTIADGATPSSNIVVMDLHGGSSAIGVQVVGNNRYLRNEGGSGNGTGFNITGNYNTMHNGAANSNSGDGVVVTGSGNLLTDTNSMGNGGNGFSVTNPALPGNRLLKLDAGETATPNGLDGVHVVGNSNTLSEIGAYANGGDGIDVAGNSNTLNKNLAGDKGKGNGQSGIRVVGGSNSLTENKAAANLGDGFTISASTTSGSTSATANLLKNDLSNTGASGSDLENVGPEFRLKDYIKNNGGGNKIDGVLLPNATKILTFPVSGATYRYASETLGE